MQVHLKPLWVLLLGASISIALRELDLYLWRVGFENPDPPFLYRLVWLCNILYWLVPGLVVGLLSTRNATWLCALAYFLSSLITFAFHDGEHQLPYRFLPDLQPAMLLEFLLFGLVGAIVGLIAAWLRHRLTIGSSDRGAHLR